jgi:hypothetical protein
MKQIVVPLIAAILTLFVAGCSGPNVDSGEIKNGRYHNSFFDFTATLPQGWTTAKRSGGNESVSLFSVENVNGDAIFGCIATEDLRGGDAEGYLRGIKRFMEDTQKKGRVTQDITSEVIGGKQFKVMAYDVNGRFNTVHQTLHVAVIKGHGLGFASGYENAEDKPALDQALQSIKFEQ